MASTAKKKLDVIPGATETWDSHVEAGATRMSEAKRYLEFVHWATGEVSTRVDVTGQSERQIEKCMRGMLINIGEGWGVRDTGDPNDERGSFIADILHSAA